MKKRLRRNGWKFLLDLVMVILLALMYNKRVLGMNFHEIGGLALCGLFIIHKLLNGKWIKAVTAGLFARRTPLRQKLFWLLDLTLLASFVFVLLSGIKISKVVFPGGDSEARFKIVHYAASAFALALSGIHVGLHMGWIGQRFGVLRKLPLLLRRVAAVALSVCVLAFGAYQLSATAFLNWIGNLTMLTASAETMPAPDEASTGVYGAIAAVEEAETAVADSAGYPADAELPSESAVESSGYGRQNSGGQGAGLRDGLGPHGNGNQASASVGSVLLSFVSILLLFSVATAWIDGSFKFFKRRRLRRLSRVTPA